MGTNKLNYDEVIKKKNGVEILALLALLLRSSGNKGYTTVLSELVSNAFFELMEVDFNAALEEVFDNADNPIELFNKILNIMLLVLAGVKDVKEMCGLKPE